MNYANPQIEELFLNFEMSCDKAIDYMKGEFAVMRAGRANPKLVDNIKVDYYGTPSPIAQVGNIAVQDGQCLVISPWDKSLLKEIEKAIQVSDIGINPTNDGTVIRLVFPVLTEERRKDIVKQVKKMSEDAKVAVRNIRRDYLDIFKKMNKNKEMTDDEYSSYEQTIEKTVTRTMEAVEKATAEKEKELMTV